MGYIFSGVSGFIWGAYSWTHWHDVGITFIGCIILATFGTIINLMAE